MVHRRDDVVEHALAVLDDYGLADLTMRRLAAGLGVGPSALYHHFPDKQTLLAAVAEEVLVRGTRPRVGTTWPEQVVEICVELRDALLAYRDAAELVVTVRGFGLGAAAPYDALLSVLRDAGIAEPTAEAAARTLVHYVLGHTMAEQTHLQAQSAGALTGPVPSGADQDFRRGLDLVLAGVSAQVPTPR